ncbi:MAG: glycosyltransferase [Deltaproteobacteria bacterium]|nr:glycosyltransferase [Deltaproteobacteria bacterium]
MSHLRPLHARELVLLARERHPVVDPLPPHRPRVTVVLLSLDRLHLTQRCIDSIFAYADYPFDLLIHDDGSQPEVLAYLHRLKAEHENVQLIESRRRLGCAAARNRAFAEAKGEYVFSLDNDTVCHPGWLRESVACAVRRAADFVAPLRLDPGGQVWSFAAELMRIENSDVLEIARWFHDLPLDSVQRWFAVSDVRTNFIPGGVGLFRRSTFQACGGFVEGYQFGFEDIDFSLKLRQRGYTVWATAQAVLMHDDAWRPRCEVDVRYARRRYDIDALRVAAALFKERWGVDVLPEKYVESLQQRLHSKLRETDAVGTDRVRGGDER